MNFEKLGDVIVRVDAQLLVHKNYDFLHFYTIINGQNIFS